MQARPVDQTQITRPQVEIPCEQRLDHSYVSAAGTIEYTAIPPDGTGLVKIRLLNVRLVGADGEADVVLDEVTLPPVTLTSP